MNDYNNGQQMKTVSIGGLTLKSLLGLIIVFSVALPRIIAGEFLYQGFMGLILCIVLGVVWFAAYSSLAIDKGPIVNLIVYLFACFMLGLFFSNSIVVAIYFIGIYSNGAVDVYLVQQALLIAAFATMVAVLGGIIMLPKIKLTGKHAKIGMNMMVIFSALTVGYMVLFFVAIIFSLFGFTGLFNSLMSVVYGLGPISMLLSVGAVLFAEALFLASAARAKMMIGNEPKHLEYFGAMIIVNGIVQIFTEIFKLVLKILARNNRD